MTTHVTNDRIVHYPADPTCFAFDSEVSKIFPDMARRSIPLYEEAHRLHVALLRPILDQPRVRVCDVGASRGHFFKEICNQLQISVTEGDERLELYAIDSSPDMLHLLAEEMPWVSCIRACAEHMKNFAEPMDIINMSYVLQFIEEDTEKTKVLRWAERNLSPDGVLILGQKDKIDPPFEERFTEEYYAFRRRNGYTDEEIKAKTEALKGAMWPSHAEWLRALVCEVGFTSYEETTRWLQFSTAICRR